MGTGHKTEVHILGFANAYGAPFAVLWTLILSPVWLASQPSMQITLALATAASLADLELIDAARDARALQVSFSIDPTAALARLRQGLPTTEIWQEHGTAGVRMDEVVPLVLWAHLAFFASRHQATLVSLQWKAVFVLTFKVPYPLSPLFVILDTFGPTALIALAVPLIRIWNVAPLVAMPDTSSSSGPGPGRQPTPAQEPQPQPMSQARFAVLAAVRAALGMSLCLGAPLLSSALSAAWLRRHLMVWKVFALWYMLGAAELLCVDVAVLGGLWLGIGRIVTRIAHMFVLPAPTASASSGPVEGQ